MSGGAFDYNCFRISQFAEELQHELDLNDSKEEDEYGVPRGRNYKERTVSNLKESLKIIEIAGKLAHEIEWLYSDDHGEDSFNKIIEKILKES